MRKLFLVVVTALSLGLAGLGGSAAAAPAKVSHANYAYNTGWPCQYFGQSVPIDSTTKYFCYTTYTWWVVHTH